MTARRSWFQRKTRPAIDQDPLPGKARNEAGLGWDPRSSVPLSPRGRGGQKTRSLLLEVPNPISQGVRVMRRRMEWAAFLGLGVLLGFGIAVYRTGPFDQAAQAQTGTPSAGGPKGKAGKP